MYIHIYYPGQSKVYFTVVIDYEFNIYWQASHIFKFLRLHKNVKKVLFTYLDRNELFKRFKDVTDSRNCNIYVLTNQQVETLLDNVRHQRQHQNGPFEAWLRKVIRGEQLLYPRNHKSFNQLINTNPFQSKGFSVSCVDGNNNDGFVYTASPSSPSAAAAAATATTTTIKPDYSAADSPYGTVTDDTQDAFLNPPSINYVAPSPYVTDQNPIEKEYLFHLPHLVHQLKLRFLKEKPFRAWSEPSTSFMPPPPPPPPSMATETPPPPMATETPPPSMATETSASPPAPPPSPTTSLIMDLEPEVVLEEQCEPDPFKLELVESKNFILKEAVFQQEYKFHAIKLNYLTGNRPLDVTTFYSHQEEQTYLFVPVKKMII